VGGERIPNTLTSNAALSHLGSSVVIKIVVSEIGVG
jgi:hypothetical protein